MRANIPDMHTFSNMLRAFIQEDINLRTARLRGAPVIKAVGIECVCEDGSCHLCTTIRGIKRILYRHDN